MGQKTITRQELGRWKREPVTQALLECAREGMLEAQHKMQNPPLSDGDIGKIALWMARAKGEENVFRQLLELSFMEFFIEDEEGKADE